MHLSGSDNNDFDMNKYATNKVKKKIFLLLFFNFFCCIKKCDFVTNYSVFK